MSVKTSQARKKTVKKDSKKPVKNVKKALASRKSSSKTSANGFKSNVKKLVKNVINGAINVLPVIQKEKKVVANNDQKETIERAQAIKRIRKSSKKPAITLPPPPVIDVSNHAKTRVRNILVSQPKPLELERNPYHELGKKYHLGVTFRQFIKVEGLSSQEFRLQRIDILEHGAVILTSKLAVDHYFRICNEMRITVPETMKYFCINEQTAYYLQKYIQYRKRKIFFGHGTILDLVDVIRKNKAEKFLLPASDVHKEQIVDFLEEVKITFTKATFYKTVAADLSDMKSLAEYDILVFFTPVGIRSLKQNFPGFKQGSTRIAAFGHTTAMQVKNLGYRLDIFAPNPQNPSMTGALDAYIREANKK
jgi:uroporphyrinogen-III synthase